jgi:hypothetical protein
MFVEMSTNLQILYAAKPWKPIKHIENCKKKHKNQNYRKQLLKGENMQLKLITGIQKTVHTSQSDSVNVQTDYKNGIIYRTVSEERSGNMTKE